jgi:uncharacterized linocin/CFP29 family protein
MDILRRASAPLSDRTWQELERAVGMTARHLMAARRVATFDGPRGWDYVASPLGTISPCHPPQGQDALVCMPDVVLLTQIRADFSVPWPTIEVFERGGPALDTDAAEKAARTVALAEDRIALYGDPVGSGFLSQKSPTSELHSWAEPRTIVSDLMRARGVLDQLSIPGPYEAVLSVPRYLAYLSAYDGGNPVRHYLEPFIAGVHRSVVMPEGGALFSSRGGDFILTVGGDLSVGYRHHDQESVHLFCLETMTAQAITPEAVCLLRDA